MPPKKGKAWGRERPFPILRNLGRKCQQSPPVVPYEETEEGMCRGDICGSWWWGTKSEEIKRNFLKCYEYK